MRTKFSKFTLFMLLAGALTALRGLLERSLPEVLLLASFILLLSAAGRKDLRDGKLPGRFAGAALLLGILGLPFFPDLSFGLRLQGSLAVSLPLFLICLVRPGAFGGGDVKLMAGCGFFLGTEAVLPAFAAAAVLAGALLVFLLLRGKAGRKDRFPFGPFLCAGMALMLMLGFP